MRNLRVPETARRIARGMAERPEEGAIGQTAVERVLSPRDPMHGVRQRAGVNGMPPLPASPTVSRHPLAPVKGLVGQWRFRKLGFSVHALDGICIQTHT